MKEGVDYGVTASSRDLYIAPLHGIGGQSAFVLDFIHNANVLTSLKARHQTL